MNLFILKATKAATDSKSALSKLHPHRPYCDAQLAWLKRHSLVIKKVCLAIDVKLCTYNPLVTDCDDTHEINVGLNGGIPQAPIPKGWYKKIESGKYVECEAHEIVFDRSDDDKKFLYENPTSVPIDSDDIEKWGYYAPYNRFHDLVQKNIVEFYNGSITQFNEQDLTPTFTGSWPHLNYSSVVIDKLNTFHNRYGPHRADIERELCRIMHYSRTLTSIKNDQRLKYFETLSSKMSMIIRNHWNIDSGKCNDDIKYLYEIYGKQYSMDGFIVLLKAYLDTIPKKMKKKCIARRREALLQNIT